jgi:hypothetical protein
MADNILSVLKDRLRQAMNDTADNAATGGCLSADSADMIAVEYAKQVGKIEGLALAERCLLDILDEIDQREKLDV